MPKVYPMENLSNIEKNNRNNGKESIELPKMSDCSQISSSFDNLSKNSSNINQCDNENFRSNIDEKISIPMQLLNKIEFFLSNWIDNHVILIKYLIIGCSLLGFHVFLAFALIHNFSKAEPFLYAIIFIWVLVIYYKIIKCYFKNILIEKIVKPIIGIYEKLWTKIIVRSLFYTCIISCILIFLLLDTWNTHQRLSGLFGIGFFFIFMVLFSNNPGRIKWRPVFWGFFLQFILGLAMLRWSWSRKKFQKVADNIVIFLDYTFNGTKFVYGFVADPPKICGMNTPFAFSALQVVIYFGAIVSLLYYYGIMQVVITKMAWFMQISLQTTATESLYACAVIFIGMSEAPLLIRPYLTQMTNSEIFTIMTSGLSCVAGSVFAVYISFGACPIYLLAASMMSAPGSIACSKIMYPETQKSQLQKIEDLKIARSEETNALEAISNGAVTAVQLVFAVIANLIVFVALLAFLDNIIAYLGEMIGYEGWSFQLFVGYIFFPLAYIMGVNENLEETLNVAKLMGTKTALNEFVAYQHLSAMLSSSPPKLSPRAAMIATYALCSFANFGSVAILIGLLGSIEPRQKANVAKLAMRSLLTATICNFMTASLAGILIENPIICLPLNANSNCFDLNKYEEIAKNFTLLI